MSSKPGSGNRFRGKFDFICWNPTSHVIAVTGTTKFVYKCQALFTNGAVIDVRTHAAPGSLEHEAAVYKRLGDHPRITKYYGVGEITPNIKAIILERSSIGCPREHTQFRQDDPPPLMAVRPRMAQDFAEGVAHMHACGVIWCDISTRNALLFTEDDWRLKLCDFGTAQFKNAETDQYDLGKGLYETTY
ncbi:kinase-like domain-containing protein [Bombardia bombarda]|uniref:Kinase-like domain-containing protein n=1 Tax=Bombardia bombarda TaxID=252184 RepID=A0AA39WUQ8_9PEZI|nr:kinase-like domain-containing protein [Bombardia bombarda]